jgi:hypothetical protein
MALLAAGFDFRATLGFVADPANCSPVLGEAYPHSYTGGSSTLNGGWTTVGVTTVNRSAVIDPRLAGINYALNSGTLQQTFRADLLNAGTYDITVALGDTSAQTWQYLQILDNVTALATFDESGGNAANSWFDGANNQWSAAAWPGSNVKVRVTFASTVAKFTIGTPVVHGAAASTLSHLFLQEISVTQFSGASSGTRDAFGRSSSSGARRRASHFFNKDCGLWLPSRQ